MTYIKYDTLTFANTKPSDFSMGSCMSIKGGTIFTIFLDRIEFVHVPPRLC